MGRAVLALGGVATLGVAALPLPSNGGSSAGHSTAAGIAFVALTVWPVLATRRAGAGARPGAAAAVRTPWGLRRPVGAVATAGLAALLGWFVAQMAQDGALVGLSERAAAGAQSLWPLVVVVSAVAGAGATVVSRPATPRATAPRG